LPADQAWRLMANHLCQLGIAAAARGISQGKFSSEDLVRDCLARIERFDPEIQAWAFLDPGLALAQARAADAHHRRGQDHGPLHGVPIAVKDIFDTRDMPTEDGTVLHKGRTPGWDAAAVERLRQAGAVVMGKTTTAALANSTEPGNTRNPHNADRSPGGSSMGSAAAVASYMVPGAIGTQTAGSIIRPAAFCGIYGYKPSFGLISRHRVLQIARSLDTVGSFARSLDDAALLAQTMMGHDDRDPDISLVAVPDLAQAAREHPPLPPRLAFARTAKWDETDEECRAALGELVAALPDAVADLDLGPTFAEAHDLLALICRVETAANLATDYERGRDLLPPSLVDVIERGLGESAVDYVRAKTRVDDLHLVLDEVFAEFDAIITPAAKGIAPLHQDGTGDSVFAVPWTLLGAPALNLPLLSGEKTMPIGVQLVGARRQDSRLMRTARWLIDQLDSDMGDSG